MKKKVKVWIIPEYQHLSRTLVVSLRKPLTGPWIKGELTYKAKKT